MSDEIIVSIVEYHKCLDDKYYGEHCVCAACRHVDGVCIDNESGSGCAACTGPESDCDLTDYE